jgi:hypothetical protein
LQPPNLNFTHVTSAAIRDLATMTVLSYKGIDVNTVTPSSVGLTFKLTHVCGINCAIPFALLDLFNAAGRQLDSFVHNS